MENMMLFLGSKNSSALVRYGHHFNATGKGGISFHSGGCGYLLSNEAFRRLGSKLTTNRSYCQNTGREDVDLAACLSMLGVYIDSSLDEMARERFLPVNLLSMYFGALPDWFYVLSSTYPQKVKLED